MSTHDDYPVATVRAANRKLRALGASEGEANWLLLGTSVQLMDVREHVPYSEAAALAAHLYGVGVPLNVIPDLVHDIVASAERAMISRRDLVALVSQAYQSGRVYVFSFPRSLNPLVMPLAKWLARRTLQDLYGNRRPTLSERIRSAGPAYRMARDGLPIEAQGLREFLADYSDQAVLGA